MLLSRGDLISSLPCLSDDTCKAPNCYTSLMAHVYFCDSDAVCMRAEAAYERHRAALIEMLPQAEIEHIGSTAIAGAVTKGDLDILVRVSASDFAAADELLAKHFARNEGSFRSDSFASFCDDTADPPLSIQLVVGGSELDDFTQFRDALRADPQLLADFNALKRECEGMDMETYRERKAAFIQRSRARRHT
jgi:GrpB-like predicted nucleotidyltransferase (UPF0157 family)